MHNLTSGNKGDVAEAIALAKLENMGVPVSIPWGDNRKYDLIIERESGKLEKIQVKSGTLNQDEGKVVVRPDRSHRDGSHSSYSKEEIDAFIFVIEESHDTMYIPVEEAADSTMHFRYTAKQDQPQINWVEDFLLTEEF